MSNREEVRRGYSEMIAELKRLGEEILLEEDDSDDDFMAEIENIDMHLECCQDILTSAI